MTIIQCTEGDDGPSLPIPEPLIRYRWCVIGSESDGELGVVLVFAPDASTAMHQALEDADVTGFSPKEVEPLPDVAIMPDGSYVQWPMGMPFVARRDPSAARRRRR
jgi:hypothetical protein